MRRAQWENYECTDSIQAIQYSKMIGQTYKYGMDTRLAIENLQYVTCKVPEDPDGSAMNTELCIWERKVDDYLNKKP